MPDDMPRLRPNPETAARLAASDRLYERRQRVGLTVPENEDPEPYESMLAALEEIPGACEMGANIEVMASDLVGVIEYVMHMDEGCVISDSTKADLYGRFVQRLSWAVTQAYEAVLPVE